MSTPVWVNVHPEPLPVTPNWAEQALCAQTDPEAFFPDKGGSTAEAKKTCMLCEVRVDCLNDALNTGEDIGVRGGMSPPQRREIQRARREAAAARQDGAA